jgi:hypothetical protein
MNQFEESVFVSEYPHPTSDPGGPKTLPSDGSRVNTTPADAGQVKDKNNPTTRIGCQNSLFLIEHLLQFME